MQYQSCMCFSFATFRPTTTRQGKSVSPSSLDYCLPFLLLGSNLTSISVLLNLDDIIRSFLVTLIIYSIGQVIFTGMSDKSLTAFVAWNSLDPPDININNQHICPNFSSSYLSKVLWFFPIPCCSSGAGLSFSLTPKRCTSLKRYIHLLVGKQRSTGMI